MPLHSSHVVGDHCLELGVTAVAAACSLCHAHVFPSCPDFGSAPTAQAAREHRWRHIEHLLCECQCIPGLDSSAALTLLRDDLCRVCSWSDHAEAVLLAAFPASRIPVVAAAACVVPFLLDPAAALGRVSPWHMKLQCLDLVAAFLLGVSSAVCTRQPLTASVLARFCTADGCRAFRWPARQPAAATAPTALPSDSLTSPHASIAHPPVWAATVCMHACHDHASAAPLTPCMLACHHPRLVHRLLSAGACQPPEHLSPHVAPSQAACMTHMHLSISGATFRELMIRTRPQVARSKRMREPMRRRSRPRSRRRR